MSNTIKLKKYSDVIEEYRAAGAITPGALIAYDAAGKVGAHAGKGGAVMPMFALEDELQGKGIADAYAANDPVQCWVPYRGDHVYALLTGAAVAKGDPLQSAGDGTLEKQATVAAAKATGEAKVGANGLTFEAANAGIAGNAVTIKLVGDEGVTAGSETVTVVGNVITVTYRNEATASTLTQIAAAINGEGDATALLSATVVGEGATEGFDADVTLAGGNDAAVGAIVGEALEAINPEAATVRVAVRIV